MRYVALVGLVGCGGPGLLEGHPGATFRGASVYEECDSWDEDDQVCTVAPSGDQTGVLDVERITAGMALVRDLGGATLELTDGDPTTHDVYYTSTNIIVEAFTGSLVGEAVDRTTLHAGPDFVGQDSPMWTNPLYNDTVVTNVLQLDFATGDVRIADLTIEVTDPEPALPFPRYDNPSLTDRSISTAIELIGFSGAGHDTVVEDVRIVAPEVSSPLQGLGYGIHDMPWVRPFDDDGTYYGWPPGNSESSLTVRNVTIENMSIWGMAAMDMTGDGELVVEDVDVTARVAGIVLARHQIPAFLSDLSVEAANFAGLILANMSSATVSDSVICASPTLIRPGLGQLDASDVVWSEDGSACDE